MKGSDLKTSVGLANEKNKNEKETKQYKKEEPLKRTPPDPYPTKMPPHPSTTLNPPPLKRTQLLQDCFEV